MRAGGWLGLKDFQKSRQEIVLYIYEWDSSVNYEWPKRIDSCIELNADINEV